LSRGKGGEKEKEAPMFLLVLRSRQSFISSDAMGGRGEKKEV